MIYDWKQNKPTNLFNKDLEFVEPGFDCDIFNLFPTH